MLLIQMQLACKLWQINHREQKYDGLVSVFIGNTVQMKFDYVWKDSTFNFYKNQQSTAISQNYHIIYHSFEIVYYFHEGNKHSIVLPERKSSFHCWLREVFHGQRIVFTQLWRVCFVIFCVGLKWIKQHTQLAFSLVISPWQIKIVFICMLCSFIN